MVLKMTAWMTYLLEEGGQRHGSAARVVGEAGRGWREAGGRGKRKTTSVTTAGKINITEEGEFNTDTFTRFGGSSVVNYWTIVDHALRKMPFQQSKLFRLPIPFDSEHPKKKSSKYS